MSFVYYSSLITKIMDDMEKEELLELFEDDSIMLAAYQYAIDSYKCKDNEHRYIAKIYEALHVCDFAHANVMLSAYRYLLSPVFTYVLENNIRVSTSDIEKPIIESGVIFWSAEVALIFGLNDKMLYSRAFRERYDIFFLKTGDPIEFEYHVDVNGQWMYVTFEEYFFSGL